MGCPIDSICDRCAGASLLRRTKKMEEIVRGMSQTLTCPLTIKIRKGYDDNDVGGTKHSLVLFAQRTAVSK